jgi:hypothetical protein
MQKNCLHIKIANNHKPITKNHGFLLLVCGCLLF